MSDHQEASPFYGFRFSSSTSVDVKIDNEKDLWNGLVSVAGVSIDELLRQAKVAFPDKYKAVFLAELPRMLTWGGSAVPKTNDSEGKHFFSEGQILEVELEDNSTGEIEDKKVTCTTDKFASVFAQVNELMAKLEEEDEVQEVPRVGLDAMMGGKNATAAGGARHLHADPNDEDEEEEAEEEEEEEDDEEHDEDLKNGLGADVRPPAAVKANALKSQLKSIVQIGQMMGLPNSEIREAWVNCGGILSEPEAGGAGGMAGMMGEDEDDMMMGAGGPPGGPAGPGCKQQ